MKTGPIFDAMTEFFEDEDWSSQWLEGKPVLSLPYAGANGKWVCFAQAREEQQQFVFYSVIPVNASPETMKAVVEYITRANYGMIMGNFEFDYRDGEIRYKTSIDVEGVTLTAPLIRQVVYANVLITDRYLPGLLRVIYAQADPATEIQAIEDSPDSEAADLPPDDDADDTDSDASRTMNGSGRISDDRNN